MYSTNKIIRTISLISAFAFVTHSSSVRAVDPSLDRGYASGRFNGPLPNTKIITNTTGGNNAGIGFDTLAFNTARYRNTAPGTMLYDQSFDGSGNAYSSQNDTAGLGNFATVYDNFTLGTASTITNVMWTGEYFNPPVQGPIAAFTVQFYADAAGQPGASLASFNLPGTAGETFLGNFNGFPTYTYSFDLGGTGFMAAAGIEYWMSIVPDLAFPPQWGWSQGVGGDSSSFQDFFGSRSNLGVDLAFTLNGEVTGGGLELVSAASRKHHGNAGNFGIDLPLTGTPGVECRVGNGGTFLQTIVFTFSEPVTSISGVTTTTCGTVNSTTISGSTVTVELGHVTCDGSDITVTVPGVTGASGSVDASATMTLLTGDVNADGVVNKTDLLEIRMNVGRGLVNEDNFRDDITVDGKVNHGDTTLEKSKR
jgi:Dockerin type I domain